MGTKHGMAPKRQATVREQQTDLAAIMWHLLQILMEFTRRPPGTSHAPQPPATLPSRPAQCSAGSRKSNGLAFLKRENGVNDAGAVLLQVPAGTWPCGVGQGGHGEQEKQQAKKDFLLQFLDLPKSAGKGFAIWVNKQTPAVDSLVQIICHVRKGLEREDALNPAAAQKFDTFLKILKSKFSGNDAGPMWKCVPRAKSPMQAKGESGKEGWTHLVESTPGTFEQKSKELLDKRGLTEAYVAEAVDLVMQQQHAAKTQRWKDQSEHDRVLRSAAELYSGAPEDSTTLKALITLLRKDLSFEATENTSRSLGKSGMKVGRKKYFEDDRGTQHTMFDIALMINMARLPAAGTVGERLKLHVCKELKSHHAATSQAAIGQLLPLPVAVLVKDEPKELVPPHMYKRLGNDETGRPDPKRRSPQEEAEEGPIEDVDERTQQGQYSSADDSANANAPTTFTGCVPGSDLRERDPSIHQPRATARTLAAMFSPGPAPRQPTVTPRCQSTPMNCGPGGAFDAPRKRDSSSSDTSSFSVGSESEGLLWTPELIGMLPPVHESGGTPCGLAAAAAAASPSHAFADDLGDQGGFVSSDIQSAVAFCMSEVCSQVAGSTRRSDEDEDEDSEIMGWTSEGESPMFAFAMP